jgi:hypothetical protein
MTGDRFEMKMIISPEQLNYMLTEDMVKNRIKEELALGLARKIMETKRATFTYTKNPLDYTVTIKGTIIL